MQHHLFKILNGDEAGYIPSLIMCGRVMDELMKKFQEEVKRRAKASKTISDRPKKTNKEKQKRTV